jgi:hypothetical protein
MRGVYVIAGPSGPRKIGIATDVRSRLAQIQTACPFKVVLEHFDECSQVDAELVEANAHTLLAGKRLYGEWFAASADEARDAVAAAKERAGAPRRFAAAPEDRAVDPALPRDPNYVYTLCGTRKYRILRLEDFGLV